MGRRGGDHELLLYLCVRDAWRCVHTVHAYACTQIMLITQVVISPPGTATAPCQSGQCCGRTLPACFWRMGCAGRVAQSLTAPLLPPPRSWLPPACTCSTTQFDEHCIRATATTHTMFSYCVPSCSHWVAGSHCVMRLPHSQAKAYIGNSRCALHTVYTSMPHPAATHSPAGSIVLQR